MNLPRVDGLKERVDMCKVHIRNRFFWANLGYDANRLGRGTEIDFSVLNIRPFSLLALPCYSYMPEKYWKESGPEYFLLDNPDKIFAHSYMVLGRGSPGKISVQITANQPDINSADTIATMATRVLNEVFRTPFYGQGWLPGIDYQTLQNVQRDTFEGFHLRIRQLTGEMAHFFGGIQSQTLHSILLDLARLVCYGQTHETRDWLFVAPGLWQGLAIFIEKGCEPNFTVERVGMASLYLPEKFQTFFDLLESTTHELNHPWTMGKFGGEIEKKESMEEKAKLVWFSSFQNNANWINFAKGLQLQMMFDWLDEKGFHDAAESFRAFVHFVLKFTEPEWRFYR